MQIYKPGPDLIQISSVRKIFFARFRCEKKGIFFAMHCGSVPIIVLISSILAGFLITGQDSSDTCTKDGHVFAVSLQASDQSAEKVNES